MQTSPSTEAFYAAQRAAGRAASTLNHSVQVLKKAFRWAKAKNYIARSPITDDSLLKRAKVAKRTRRVSTATEAALLAAASPRLQRIIVAAIDTGMRRAEILKLRWSDVDLEECVITVRAETAKDKEIDGAGTTRVCGGRAVRLNSSCIQRM